MSELEANGLNRFLEDPRDREALVESDCFDWASVPRESRNPGYFEGFSIVPEPRLVSVVAGGLNVAFELVLWKWLTSI